MLRLVIPKGSLEAGTFKLFEQANLPIIREDDRSYNFFIDDQRISEVVMLRPQEIPKYIEEGEFDLGVVGSDWISESGAEVKEILDLWFSKQSRRKVRIILAADEGDPIDDVKRIRPNARVATEYPRLTENYFRNIGVPVKILYSYGATEAKVPRLADYLVDVTETGETLEKNNKKIIAIIMESSTKLISNLELWQLGKNEKEEQERNVKRKAIEEIAMLLLGAIQARGKVLIKMNVQSSNVEKVIANLPSLKAPTISPLYSKDPSGEKWFMVETVVDESQLNIIIPKIKEAGAIDILELDISKMIL